MWKIPPEILANILDHVPRVEVEKPRLNTASFRWTQLAQYSTVSRAWKGAVEQITFKELAINSNELDTFAALYSGENIVRRTVLRSISFDLMLPPQPNLDGCCNAVRAPDREVDSAVFSASITKLLSILAETEARAGTTPPLRFGFEKAFRPSKFEEPKRNPDCSYSFEGMMVMKHDKQEIWEAEAAFGQFELVNPDSVPIVRGITCLDYYGMANDMHDLKYTWIPVVVNRLPNLEHLYIITEDCYEDGRYRRMQRRNAFASTIQSLVGSHISRMKLRIWHSPMYNEDVPVQKLVEEGKWGQDAWHCMFNHLANFPCLAILRLEGGLVICPEFFRGIINQQSTPFPSLVELAIEFSVETADGRWFLKRDDAAFDQSRNDPEYTEFWEENDEHFWQDDEMSDWSEDYVRVFEDEPWRTGMAKWDRFRSLPDEITFLPFLLDASTAVSRMPKLKSFQLKLGNCSARYDNLDYYPIVTRVFELWYLKDQLHWRVDRWKPWDEVQAAWGALVGPEGKIFWLGN